MNKNTRKGSFFAKAEGAAGWRDRFAGLMGAKAAKKASAKLEIDDQGSGETMIFPDIADISELTEGVTVEATDGTHVFETDGTTYTIEVAGGKVTSVTKETAADPAEASALNEETQEFVQAVAEALDVNDAFRAEANGKIEALTSQLAEAVASVAALKKAMGHKDDGMGAGSGEANKTATINGKKIDLDKINFNKK